MLLIIISLALAAAYAGGLWLFVLYQSLSGQFKALDLPERALLAHHSFHLGICFIASTGLLGLILKGV